jgi:hypothetical protein
VQILNVDLSNGVLLSKTLTGPATPTVYFGDTVPLNLKFYTSGDGVNSGTEEISFDGTGLRLGIGPKGGTALITATNWVASPDLSATISTTVAGSSSVSAVQKLQFNQSPTSGFISFYVPSRTGAAVAGTELDGRPGVLNMTTSVHSGLFSGQVVTILNKQYVIAGPVTPTGFGLLAMNDGDFSDFIEGQTYSINTLAQSTQPLQLPISAAMIEASLMSNTITPTPYGAIGLGGISVSGQDDRFLITYTNHLANRSMPLLSANLFGYKKVHSAQLVISGNEIKNLMLSETPLFLEIATVSGSTKTTLCQSSVTILPTLF